MSVATGGGGMGDDDHGKKIKASDIPLVHIDNKEEDEEEDDAFTHKVLTIFKPIITDELRFTPPQQAQHELSRFMHRVSVELLQDLDERQDELSRLEHHLSLKPELPRLFLEEEPDELSKFFRELNLAPRPELVSTLRRQKRRKIASSSSPPSSPPRQPQLSQQPQLSRQPQWIDLPSDITANILQRLGSMEILKVARKVCTKWRRVCQDPAMWRVVHMTKSYRMNDRFFQILCHQAIDYSQGQLVDLSIDNFVNDELINYIAHRSSHLRRLQLMGGEYTVEALKKLPNLEELELIFTLIVEAADIETIGISFPMLKSFTFCRDTSPGFIIRGKNEYALAIAKTMPNLRRLTLYGNALNNEGLEAILDACPRLESLDLRRCYYLDLSTDLGRRCFHQIKDVKGPTHSISDIWWLAPAACFEYLGYKGYYNHLDSHPRYRYHHYG